MLRQMKACGVIVEYNPFHNGHQYHVEQARQKSGAEVVIAVMSGDFLQRGEPAIIDKWSRAAAALANGVDLVIELPFAWAVQSADYFARGSVKLLQALQCDSLCFGTDSETTVDYQAFGTFVKEHQSLIDQTYQELGQKNLSYPQQMTAVFRQLYPELKLDFSSPNHILGLSYAKENARFAQPMQLYPLQRKMAEYHETTISGNIASATAIREALQKKQDAAVFSTVPTETAHYLTTDPIVTWEHYWPFLQYKLISTPATALKEIYQVKEGLEYRLKAAARQATDFISFINKVKTKRYTWTRLQRLAVYILTNTTHSEIEAVWANSYLHLLGFTKKGQQYLKENKQAFSLPLISRVAKENQELLALDIRSGNIYQLGNSQLKEQNFGRIPYQFLTEA